MARFVIISFLIGFTNLSLFAQGGNLSLTEKKSITEKLDILKKDYAFDRTSSSIYDTIILNTNNYSPDKIPTFSKEVIQDRMANIPTIIPMDYNRYVQAFIDLYTKERREQVSRMLGLEKVYFPIFEAELDRMKMPMELKYLSVVESALNPHARSRVGATGLWQFMYRTGKEYGLKVDSFVDERKDPYKSTIAAMRYLKNAHKEFGDWLLAIASYNCGAGNVRKAIYRSGGKRDFWSIRPYLPRETSGYVPAFIAATYTFQHASEHNIYPIYVDFSMEQDTLHIRNLDITLEELAKASDTKLTTLKNLNPELKLSRIPFTNKPYILRVPVEVADYFVQNESELRKKYGKRRYNKPSELAASSPTYPKPKGKLQYYTVKDGDVVGTIAEKFGVSARNIAYWNNLRRYRIKVGQKLKIYSNKRASGSSSGKSSSSTAVANAKGATYHTVKNGDTMWTIANEYPGLTLSKIRNLNPGVSASKLKIGQKLRIK